MSLVLQSSGGGQITIQEPATASNFTQTLPAATGTVMVSGNQPAFSAYMSTNPSWANGVVTKIPFNIEEFDTANCFDSTTNYRFTPNVAGYYQVTGGLSFGNTVATGAGYFYIYKNGSEFKRGNTNSLNAANFTEALVSALIYMNGSTDYLELYGVQTSGSSLTQNGGASLTYFQAVMVRAA